MNKLMGKRASSDKKMTNALKSFIIAPMSVMGYVIHPILIPMIQNRAVLSILLILILGAFAFANLKIANWLRAL
ncbi:MAG: hypothetical protein ABI844_13320 [Saprospiraceae bacterium]